MEQNNPVTYFAETDHRKKVPFGIKASDRTRHVYVIGKTGMGKSTLLENMAIQDIQSGNGMAFVDPHGRTAELLLEYIPKERLDDVIYFAPFDMEHPMSFNIMEDVGYDKRHLVANGLMSAFKKIWVDAWSARMEYILNNVILALLEYPDATLLGVNRMLTDKGYRKAVVDNIKDPATKSFWVDEFAKYTDRYTQEATPAIQNKVGQFTANPLIRNIIGQPKSSFDLRDVMDNKKILIINLSKGRIGEGNANLLGSMIITKLYLAAMSRADLSDAELNKRPNFYMFVDEFQSFANESFADILSEARKYKLNLTIAHQYIEQMPEEVRTAVFGNVGTMISFRVGAYDADVLEKEYAPKFYAEDMVNLGFTQIYLKLMINGVSSQPFSATTLPPIKSPEGAFVSEVTERSRKLYAKPRIQIQDEIDMWYAKDFTPKKPEKSKRVPGELSPFEQAKAKARAGALEKDSASRSRKQVKNSSLVAQEKQRDIQLNLPQQRSTDVGRSITERRNVTDRRKSTPAHEKQINTRKYQANDKSAQKQSVANLRTKITSNEIDLQNKNTDSLKVALAELLDKEKGGKISLPSTKQKSTPLPTPRFGVDTSIKTPEKISEKTQENTVATAPTLEKKSATKISAVIHQKKGAEKPKLHVPKSEDSYKKTDHAPSTKTTQKAGEVPEDVLKKVLGI